MEDWRREARGSYSRLLAAVAPQDNNPGQQIDDGPLYQRGWTAQERLLSPRIIHFCSDQIRWECDELTTSEDFPDGLPRGKQPNISGGEWPMFARELSIRRLLTQGNDHAYDFWLEFVDRFSAAELTVENDKLPAVDGLAQILGRITGDRYLSGCWLQDIPRGLLWAAVNEPVHIPAICRAPSWSWASVNGGVSFWCLPFGPKASYFSNKFSAVACTSLFNDSTAQEFGSTAVGLVVDGPLYCIRHRIWTGASSDRENRNTNRDHQHTPTCVQNVYLDARWSRKPTDPDLTRQHLLRWALPTHVLPLVWRELWDGYHVYGLLLVRDPEKDATFIRVGWCRARLKEPTAFGVDGTEQDHGELARAGLSLSELQRFVLQ